MKKQKIWHIGCFTLGIFVLIILGFPAEAASGAATVPDLTLPRISVGMDGASGPEETAQSLQILFLLTVLSLAPAILVLTTSFTRVVVVLGFIRNALATQQMPPNQVIMGLALFLTFFIMAPTWNSMNQQALQPYLAGQISQQKAMVQAMEPLRQFMFKQTREKDLALLVNLSQTPRPNTYRDIPTLVLIPAFVISELKTAFQMGALIFLPFIVIDMVVASTLMSMGMMMLPPMMISLPFKILLFVMVDGWYLVVRSLVLSFQ